MTDTRESRGPAARRARALVREETAGQRRLEKLGIHIWPDGWPKPSTWDVPGLGVRRRSTRWARRASGR